MECDGAGGNQKEMADVTVLVLVRVSDEVCGMTVMEDEILLALR